jgi:hypothetical protein
VFEDSRLVSNILPAAALITSVDEELFMFKDYGSRSDAEDPPSWW